MGKYDFDVDVSDLVENPTTRVPIALVLDTSGSMIGEPINELNDGYKIFLQELENDEVARYAAEICVITFGGNIDLVQDFSPIDKVDRTKIFVAGGDTPMGTAVVLAIERLEFRKNLYKESGIDYHQPWLVLMTDGEPTDDITKAVEKVQDLISNKKLVIFPIAIGPRADMKKLQLFSSPNRLPLRLKGTKFKEFFMWLSKSVSSISRSSPGEKIKLDKEGLSGWAEI